MENVTSMFVHPDLNFQFLSVCHYITGFGIFFYNNDLLSINDRNRTLPVLNALFDYLNKSDNESELKLQLLRKVLKGTDLYGGGNKETLDMKYVNETYQYIISNALFSHYGNIPGYLAKIVNRLDNMTVSVLKQKVFQNLTENYINVDYCSPGGKTGKLSPNTLRKVFHDYVWSIFPETDIDTSLIDAEFLYAMAGLKFVRSIAINEMDMQFDHYVLLARRLEFLAFNNETHFSALEVFATPVLLFYAYLEREKFHEVTTFSSSFWMKAYDDLFSYFNVTVHGIIQQALESSLYDKLEDKLKTLNTRTIIASRILKKRCHYQHLETAPKFLIGMYKTLTMTQTKLLLPTFCNVTNFPNLKHEYAKQFDEIQKMYFEIMKNSIRLVFEVDGLMGKINSQKIYLARISKYVSDASGKSKAKNHILFGIKGDETEFYLLRQENSVLSLLPMSRDKGKFVETLGFDPLKEEESSLVIRVIKEPAENSDVFVNAITKVKTDQFIEALMEYYKEPIAAEKILQFLTSLVPFYSCFQNFKKGKQVRAALSCSVDVIKYFPISKTLGRFATIMQIVFSLQKHETPLIRDKIAGIENITGLAARSSMSPIFKTAAENIANVRRRNQTIRQLSLISKLEPGSELSYCLSPAGVEFTQSMLKNIISMTQYHAELYEIVVSMRKLFLHLNRRNDGYLVKNPDHPGLVGQLREMRSDHHLVRYFYPGGRNFYGPKCFEFDKFAELRSIRNRPLEMLVVQEGDKEIHYRELDPEMGELSACSMIVDNNGLLHFENSKNQFGMECDFEGLHHEDEMELGKGTSYHGGGKGSRKQGKHPGGSLSFRGSSEGFRGSSGGFRGSSESLRRSSGSFGGLSKGFRGPTSFEESAENSGSRTGLAENRTGSEEVQNLSAETILDSSGSAEGFQRPDDSAEANLNSRLGFRGSGSSKLSRANLHSMSSKASARQVKGFRNTGKPFGRRFSRSIKVLQTPAEVSKTSAVDSKKLAEASKGSKVPNASAGSFLGSSGSFEGFRGSESSRRSALANLHSKLSKASAGQAKGSREAGKPFGSLFRSTKVLQTATKISKTSAVGSKKLAEAPKGSKVPNASAGSFLGSSGSSEGFRGSESSRRSTQKNLRAISLKLSVGQVKGSRKVEKLFRRRSSRSTKVLQTPVEISKTSAVGSNKLAKAPKGSKVPNASAGSFLGSSGSSEGFRRSKSSKQLDEDQTEANLHSGSSEASGGKGEGPKGSEEAKRIIDKLYAGIYELNVMEAYETYRNSSAKAINLRFEDFYALCLHAKDTVLINKDTNRRIMNAIYTLADKQQHEKWIKDPIVLHRIRRFSPKNFKIHATLERKSHVFFEQMTMFSVKLEDEMEHLKKKTQNSRKPILFQINLRNQTGVANIGRVVNEGKDLHVIPARMMFVIDDIVSKIIQKQEVIVIKMHDLEVSDKEKMKNVKKALKILSGTDTEFYYSWTNVNN